MYHLSIIYYLSPISLLSDILHLYIYHLSINYQSVSIHPLSSLSFIYVVCQSSVIYYHLSIIYHVSICYLSTCYLSSVYLLREGRGFLFRDQDGQRWLLWQRDMSTGTWMKWESPHPCRYLRESELGREDSKYKGPRFCMDLQMRQKAGSWSTESGSGDDGASGEASRGSYVKPCRPWQRRDFSLCLGT
jgi:hypothetical protein